MSINILSVNKFEHDRVIVFKILTRIGLTQIFEFELVIVYFLLKSYLPGKNK